MYRDNRGYLIFPIKDGKYMDKRTFNMSKDCTYSVNKKYVFRGLHINTFGKLITCISGHFIDYMVNMETFKVQQYDIRPGDQIYCPGNFAHGFISLEENSVLSYHCEGYFGNEEGGLLNYRDPILNIKLPNGIEHKDLIINEKDSKAPYLQFDYFLLGANGYIGSAVLKELKNQEKRVHCLKERMEDLKGIKRMIEVYRPKYFINCAGLTGIPNTSWCNTHQKETLMTNVINQINILNLCNEYSIHCTVIGSGAIFKNSKEPKYSHSEGDLIDDCNYYAKCRIMLEEQVKAFDNCLLLRINYPLSSDLKNSKNLILKILKYENIENISLSVTNLDSMCPIIPRMIENNETGTFNFVNYGQLNIIDLYLSLKEKFNDKINKTFIDTKRESVKLIPDKLEKYSIEDISRSLNGIFSKF